MQYLPIENLFRTSFYSPTNISELNHRGVGVFSFTLFGLQVSYCCYRNPTHFSRNYFKDFLYRLYMFIIT